MSSFCSSSTSAPISLSSVNMASTHHLWMEPSHVSPQRPPILLSHHPPPRWNKVSSFYCARDTDHRVLESQSIKHRTIQHSDIQGPCRTWQVKLISAYTWSISLYSKQSELYSIGNWPYGSTQVGILDSAICLHFILFTPLLFLKWEKNIPFCFEVWKCIVNLVCFCKH